MKNYMLSAIMVLFCLCVSCKTDKKDTTDESGVVESNEMETNDDLKNPRNSHLL